MTDVYQCPYCELRFLTRTELEDHVADAHPGRIDRDTQSVED